MWLSLKIALASLAVHKLRTVLAMLGVFLGALALTGVQHVSQSMVRQAELETEKLGPNLFAALSGQVRFRRTGATAGGLTRSFTLDDAITLHGSLPGVLASSPFAQKTRSLRYESIQVSATLHFSGFLAEPGRRHGLGSRLPGQWQPVESGQAHQIPRAQCRFLHRHLKHLVRRRVDTHCLHLPGYCLSGSRCAGFAPVGVGAQKSFSP